MQKKSLLLSAAALVASATLAYASVTFDPATGTGFVGKGDVQLAFGWNNAAAQRYGRDVSFTYNATDTYEATCTWTTGEGTRGERTHSVSIPRHTSINSAITYDARTHKQIDGYVLLGNGSTTSEGTAPVIGEACVGGEEGIAQNGTWTAVTLISSGGGGLFVSWNGSSVQLQ